MNDIFDVVHGDKGLLSTELRRKQYFKKNFRYVAPVTMYPGFDKNGTKRYFEYVPIIETIQQLLKDPAVKSTLRTQLLAQMEF